MIIKLVSAPIEFDGAGNFLENGYEANSSTEYVVELILVVTIS